MRNENEMCVRKGKGFLLRKLSKEREEGSGSEPESMWAGMLPEVLMEIIERVERSEERWPNRQNVVACGCVCKRWREITRDVVGLPSLTTPKITFPSCLKQVWIKSLSYYFFQFFQF